MIIATEIRRKMAESDYSLRQLELWEAAEAQGIDSSHGGSFGFDTRLLTKAQRHKRHWQGCGRPKLFNYFRYPNDRVVTLDPMLEAVYRDSDVT